MSGGGASPAIKETKLVEILYDGIARIVTLISGGRARPLIQKGPVDSIFYVVNKVSPGGFGKGTIYSSNPTQFQLVSNLAEMYGLVPFETESAGGYINKIIIGDNSYNASEIIEDADFDVYENFGFVEGVARITTPVGDAACVVKNGTLYPIITEYDQATEDNWTLQDVYLNGDNEVSNLQQMVDRSGTYLAYTEDQEADKWSPIENYLHMHVKMPIVPKIGFVPAQQVGLGDLLPGLNYAVTL